MRNIKCSRCGNLYPASYRRCPYCSGKSGGRRPPPDNPADRAAAFLRQHGERIFLVSTGVFLVIAVLGMLLTRCAKDPEPADDVKTPPQEEQEPPAAEPMALSQTVLSLFAGETAELSVSGGSGEAVWTSSDEAVAGVAGGVVTAKAAGTATITASCGTDRVSCAVTVTEKEPDVEVYLNRTDFTLRPGDPAFQMKVKVKETKKDYEGTVVWSSADPNVVTVSETGLVERAGRGSTTVTATIGGKILECIVRVS